MTKIIGLRVLAHPELKLCFSDGAHGVWSAADIIARGTVLTRPLANPDYFGRAFIESGALAWPNGLEFSPSALHAGLAEAGRLERQAA